MSLKIKNKFQIGDIVTINAFGRKIYHNIDEFLPLKVTHFQSSTIFQGQSTKKPNFNPLLLVEAFELVNDPKVQAEFNKLRKEVEDM